MLIIVWNVRKVMREICGFGLSFTMAAMVMWAQSDAQPAAFEVASIKPSAIPAGREGGNRSRVEYTSTSLTMLNVSLLECVEWAYGVDSFQVSSAHLSADSYDILARAASPAPVTQLRIMLQDLLASRFKLVLHRESRMLPVYELTVAKGGPRLPPSTGPSAVRGAESLPRVEGDSFAFTDVSMPEFARMFAKLRGIDLPVIDHTGIAGNYDLVLRTAPDAAREGDTAALFAIVQRELGLKLTAAKTPLEVVVIDHAGKPSGN